MPAAPRSSLSPDLRNIASLGEQIVSAPSLSEQRDIIVGITSRFMKGEAHIWLRENFLRLPNISDPKLFPAEPTYPGMKGAMRAHDLRAKKQRGSGRNASRETWAAIPLEEQGMPLGALQVTRPDGPEFTSVELESLKAIGGVISSSLLAAHRIAVERFRHHQLNLVREVSAQIANVMDVDDLSRRVTGQIQKTFHYYYVAIFTLRRNSTSLQFRASAMPRVPRQGRGRKTVALDVEMGQGLIGQAAASGERILVEDVRNDPSYRFIAMLPETRSEAVIPLKIEDRVLGVLDIQSDKAHAFHPNDLLILEALADSIARAVEGAGLYSDLKRRADQLSLIAEVSKSVSSSLEIRTLMENVANLIHDRFGYPYVHLFTVHPIRRLIEYRAGSGTRSQNLSGYTLSMDDGQGIIPWVSREGKTVLANDVKKDARYRPSPLPPEDINSELCVPFLYDNRVVGVLDIQSHKPNAFTEDDHLLFDAIADNIATAIHNADLYASEQWRRRVADGVREVAGLISADVSVDDVLEAILSELDRNLPVDISAIWLLEDDELYLAACHNCDENLLEATLYANPEYYDGMLKALYSEDPIIRKPSDPIWVTGAAAGFDQEYSGLGVPLRVGDQHLGLITLAHNTPGRYGHEAQAMTTTFASYAAVAIENARLYDSAQEQAYASAALLQVAQAIVSLSDLDEILGTIIRIMPILVGVERAALYQWDAEKDVYRPSQQYGLSEQDEPVFWSRSFSPGEFAFLDSCRGSTGLMACELPDSRGLNAWLSVDLSQDVNLGNPGALLYAIPIAVRNDLYGVILIEEASGGLRFRSRRLEIITGIAQQAALAIQNDLLQKEMVVRERLETEVQLARKIQQTFIPEQLPQFSNWDLAARWRTARQVGGDFYDVFELPDNRLGLFIADVADKGVPAALFMALTRTLVRAAVNESNGPAEALRRVNELLVPDTKQGMFVTAVYAVLDMHTSELAYVNAGHNPPLWIKCDGSLERLTRTGVALGASEEARYEQRVIQFQEEDNLLLYTDGLTESFNIEGEFFGEQRLIEAIQANRCTSATELLDVVEKSLLEFVQDMPAADDLTMLVLRRV